MIQNQPYQQISKPAEENRTKQSVHTEHMEPKWQNYFYDWAKKKTPPQSKNWFYSLFFQFFIRLLLSDAIAVLSMRFSIPSSSNSNNKNRLTTNKRMNTHAFHSAHALELEEFQYQRLLTELRWIYLHKIHTTFVFSSIFLFVYHFLYRRWAR